MVQLSEVFDSSQVPERQEFESLPPGNYSAMIVDSQLTDTSKGGQMIVLEIEIQDDEFSGRKVFERLNIVNSNDKAVDIAYRTLGEIVRAVGKTTIKDTTELHNKRLTITLGVKPPEKYTDKNGVEQPGTPQNTIKKYALFSAGNSADSHKQQTKVAAETKPQESQSSEASNVPPWKRKKA